MSTDVIPTPRSQALLLPSGRRLGIAEQGESQGITMLVRFAPWTLRPVFKLLQWRMAHNPRRLVEDALNALPARDQATFTDPLLRRMLIETSSEPFRSGTGGVYDDTLAVARPWGFAPEAGTVGEFGFHARNTLNSSSKRA